MMNFEQQESVKHNYEPFIVDYISGFFCLPMVWLLVVLNWWHTRKATTEKGKQMRTCK